MAKDKLSKYLFIAAICCFLIGLYPVGKGEGGREDGEKIYKMEFSLGLVFDPFWKYSRYKYENDTVNSKMEFGLVSWSSLFILLGIILLRYK